MSSNPILDELHAVRAKLLTDAGDDLDRLIRGIRKRQAASGLRVVKVPLATVKKPDDGTIGKV